MLGSKKSGIWDWRRDFWIGLQAVTSWTEMPSRQLTYNTHRDNAYTHKLNTDQKTMVGAAACLEHYVQLEMCCNNHLQLDREHASCIWKMSHFTWEQSVHLGEEHNSVKAQKSGLCTMFCQLSEDGCFGYIIGNHFSVALYVLSLELLGLVITTKNALFWQATTGQMFQKSTILYGLNASKAKTRYGCEDTS